MKKILVLGALLLVLAACSTAPAPTKVLYFADYAIGTDYAAAGLASSAYAVTVATDWTDFNTKLAAGPSAYKLAVIMNQNSGIGANLATLTTYLGAGGRAVLADWTEDSSFGTLFNATYTGNDNNPSPTISFTSMPALGIGLSSSTLTLTNPGWGTYSMGLAPASGGLSVCTFNLGDSCVVLGNAGRTALVGFLSDTLPAADGAKFYANLYRLVLK